MHLARLFGKGGSDILGVCLDMGAKTFEERIGLLALAEPRIRILPWLAAPLLHGRCHRRFLYHTAAAVRADDGARFRLVVISISRRKPGVELVALVADKRKADHEASFLAASGSGPAIATSKSRPCLSAGMRARASADAARSISAKTTPGSSPPSARISPQGETIRLWPKVERPFSCKPPWAAASTNVPVSIARARIRTCQCASPVCLVKAAGTAMNSAPASASARYSAAKRRS